MYAFLLNMWITNRIDEVFLQEQVNRNRITHQDYDMIVAAPRLQK